jgi:hypothetical protein
MAPKHHPAPLSGGDRKALEKELSKSRAMTHIFAERSGEKRREGEALIREADNLSRQPSLPNLIDIAYRKSRTNKRTQQRCRLSDRGGSRAFRRSARLP